MFPRTRRTGASAAVCDLGLLACIHGLLVHVYKDFIESNYGPWSLAIGGGGPGGSSIALAEEADDVTQASASNPMEKSAAANRMRRGASARWLSGKPGLDLTIVATVLQPMQRLMATMLDVASSVGATKAVSAAGDAIAQGKSVAEALSAARWPLLVAAEGSLEDVCFEQLAALQDPAHFEHWPPQWKTLRAQVALFCLVSREAAGVHELLKCKHERFPYRLLRLAGEPDLLSEVEESCDASRDEWSKDFMQKYSG